MQEGAGKMNNLKTIIYILIVSLIYTVIDYFLYVYWFSERLNIYLQLILIFWGWIDYFLYTLIIIFIYRFLILKCRKGRKNE